ncbi:alpha/beta hydrolase [Paraclostridium sp. AKS73]|uniref:alpha/beta hydrolase n=1 Tax=Paraclostridium sp. AKS73 TaxID=2876116 RepID=UPI0021DF678F|nr:alpha/beta fold hydrolase [Paraclostridium sp. AKS73]MCU9816713.1 alpha/beta fold hydrolase [Paraclostridium sp. AKS73]
MDLKKSYKFNGNNIGCLLIHGFTSTPAEMYPLAKVLNDKGYTVNSILLSGHGTTHDELLKVSYIDWYNDVESAYEELLFECEKVIVIGHSMGGLLALILASNYHIDKLILLACAIKPNNRLVKYTGVLKYFKNIRVGIYPIQKKLTIVINIDYIIAFFHYMQFINYTSHQDQLVVA